MNVLVNGTYTDRQSAPIRRVPMTTWATLFVLSLFCVLTAWNVTTSIEFAGAVHDLRRVREGEAENARNLESARKRQVVLEAELLVTQERNLKLAKQLTKALE